MNPRPDAATLRAMANVSPYRSLPAERRVALVAHAVAASPEGRALFVARLAGRGGFRPVTLHGWPADRLAKEVVRLRAETPQDELELLQLLYVEREPAIQITFCDAAGVPHEEGRIAESAEPPYADADAVRRAVQAVREAHGEEGERYLRTLARYAAEAWPGIRELAAEGTSTAS
jgi:hypothetical protein